MFRRGWDVTFLFWACSIFNGGCFSCLQSCISSEFSLRNSDHRSFDRSSRCSMGQQPPIVECALSDQSTHDVMVTVLRWQWQLGIIIGVSSMPSTSPNSASIAEPLLLPTTSKNGGYKCWISTTIKEKDGKNWVCRFVWKLRGNHGKSLNSNRLSSVSLLKLLFVDIPYF